MTTQTKQTPYDAWDAWCHGYEAALYDAEAREAWAQECAAREAARMYTAEVSGDDRPLWWRRAEGALIVAAAAGVACWIVLAVGEALRLW